MKWYYLNASKQQMGPFTDEQFNELVANGTIQAGTYVWRAGMKNWAPYGQLAQNAGAAASAVPATAACSQCGNVFSTQDMIQYQGQWICAACKPVFFQRLQQGVATGNFSYGGFWIRFVAKIIDGVILVVVDGLLLMVFGALLAAAGPGASPGAALGGYAVLNFLTLSVNLAYQSFFLGRFGATPGKMALGLKVIHPDGRPLTYMDGLGRAAAEIITGLTFTIGYVIAAFDSEKRALHDHIANTRVIRT